MADKAGVEVPPPEVKPEDDFWLQLDGGENVKQLHDSDFDEFVAAESSVMVMFYAPCKYKSCSNEKVEKQKSDFDKFVVLQPSYK